MALPKLSIPTYSLKIPSSGKKIKFRPFLSKEEKVLMLVKQSENSAEILQAMRDITDVCTFNKLDMPQMPLFDLEYVFLQLRSKSIGEVIEIDMKCNNQVPKLGVEDENMVPCGGLIPFSIGIPDIQVTFPEDHTNVIKLEKDIGITMRYPSIDDMEMLEDNKQDDVEIIKALIENVFDKENVYEASDTKEDDLQDFVDNISSMQLEDIRKQFFYTMPFLSHEVKYKCPKCGFEGEYTFTGINDFF